MRNVTSGAANLGASGGSTKWSVILGAQDPSSSIRREALEALIRIYWRPVYFIIRKDWGKTNEDAKDMTQAFFLDFLERDSLSNVSQNKGRFRTFLWACLNNFLRKQYQADGAQKRGGGKKMISLEFITAEGEIPADLRDARTPEELFDRAWERAVFQEAIQRLEAAYQQENRSAYYLVFDAYDLKREEKLSYAKLAERLDIGETDVTNYLAHARRRFRTVVEELVKDSVAVEEDAASELGEIFGEPE